MEIQLPCVWVVLGGVFMTATHGMICTHLVKQLSYKIYQVSLINTEFNTWTWCWIFVQFVVPVLFCNLWISRSIECFLAEVEWVGEDMVEFSSIYSFDGLHRKQSIGATYAKYIIHTEDPSIKLSHSSRLLIPEKGEPSDKQARTYESVQTN